MSNFFDEVDEWCMLNDELNKLGFTLENPIDRVFYYSKDIDNITIIVSEKKDYEVVVFDYGEDTETQYDFITIADTIKFINSVIRKTKIKRLIE